MGHRALSVVVAAIVLSALAGACGLNGGGLAEDVHEGVEASTPLESGSVVSSGDGSADRDMGDLGPSADSDALNEVADTAIDAPATEAAAIDVAAPSCALPAGATMCCGAVACTNHDSTCDVVGVCAKCQS